MHTQNPGKSFSIKGRIISIDNMENKLYKFEIHSYTKQVCLQLLHAQKNVPINIMRTMINGVQVKQVFKGKLCSLPPKPLKSCEFEHKLDSVATSKLITLSPLFPCLNHQQPE